MQLNEYLESVMEERLADLHTVSMAKIMSVNNITRKASVKPLFDKLLKDGRRIAAPIINDVPFTWHRYQYTDTLDTSAGTAPTTTRLVEGPIYQAGDVVLIVYAERAIDAALSGKEGVPPYSRKHSIDDAVIVGLIGPGGA